MLKCIFEKKSLCELGSQETTIQPELTDQISSYSLFDLIEYCLRVDTILIYISGA